MNFKRITQYLFKTREYPNFHTVSFPAYFISFSVLGLSFIAYMLGGVNDEYTLRSTVLISLGFAVLVTAIHWLHPELAKWAAVFCLSAQICVLARLWEIPDLLFLLVIPIILTAVVINTPATAITAIVESLTLVVGSTWIANLSLAPGDQIILQLCVWCTALTMISAFLFIEHLFSQAATDYNRLQELLAKTRGQQQQLAQTLDDLEHANRQLSLLYEKNISLRKTAEEATEAKTNYIARVSHEIRTPLSMILGITESIIENQDVYADETPLDLMDDIRVVRRNSEHLLSLVNDVLDLTRAETNQLILHKEWTNIVEEIGKSVEIISPLARKKKLDIQVLTPRALPEIYCDRTRIRQVILNLLTNAIRYTNQGRISVSTSVDEFNILICIKDTGAGIEPEDIERIFEPFYRGKQNISPDIIGSGLGLSVCRQFVDLHGGKIWLESQPGTGSSFYVRLPLTRNDPIPRSPASFVNEQWAWVERRRNQPGKLIQQPKRHVVICTQADTLFNQMKQLDPQGDYSLVNDVPGLVHEVEKTPAHFILVNAPSLDLLLAQMETAARDIKDTPLLGTTFTSLQEQVLLTGAAGYVQKPFRAEALRQAISTVVNRPRRILIVDDNIDVQKLIVRMLSTEADYECTEFLLAVNGKEALQITPIHMPNLILLDLALSDMSGWDIIRELKKDTTLCDIPVIIVSAHDLNDAPNRSKTVIMMRGEGFSMNEFMARALGHDELLP
jgi:signal transduction histidine kinase/CheY-like chemotaxis protein